MRSIVSICFAGTVMFLAGTAAAGRCDLFNDTGTSFTIESGNVSNQRVGGHTHTSIAAGKIIAKGDDGKGAGGSCADGAKIKIVQEQGVYLILPQ